jgi:hypothetical protein
MALNPKAVASWGLLAGAGTGGGRGVTQVIESLEVTLESLEPLEVTLEVTEINVELSDG